MCNFNKFNIIDRKNIKKGLTITFFGIQYQSYYQNIQIQQPQFNMKNSVTANFNPPTINHNANSESMQINALPVNINVITSFLHIHLKDQYEKSKYSRSEFIRYRQIIEHAELILVDGSAKHQYLLDLLEKVWMETIIQICLKDFEEQYFAAQDANIKILKKTVAQRYLFQLSKLRQFVESGRRNFEGKETQKQVNLSTIFTLSDENLYHVLQRKNSMFIDKDSKDRIDYPRSLDSFQEYKYNILSSFKSRSLEKQQFLNKDYIFQDIRFLLNKAVQEWDNFQKDMTVLFGGKLQTNLKVKKQQNGGFNVIGVRRILTKWVEILLENDKELASSSRFYNFIMKKSLVYDTFYMNDKDSRVPPCQQKICHLLLQLLICSVFHGDQMNEQFGLFIYDLLRGKTSVSSIEEMELLVNKLKNPPTELKNNIQVFRMKNRLKTHNRDLLINFKYGGVLAAQIQIGLAHSGSPEEKKKYKKMYQYKHFIYELSRSIFGPTIQLMNIYQDYYRQGVIKMYSTGIVSLRDTKPFQGINFTDKQCFANHKLVYIKSQLKKKKELCRSCFQQLSNYLHCFQCTVSFCEKCVNDLPKKKRLLLNSRDADHLKRLHKIQDIFNLEGLNLVIFHLEYSPASTLMLKYISYLLKLKEYTFNIFIIDVLEDPRVVYYIQKYFSLDRFPAFGLFHDSDLKKCIVGASLYKIVDLINLLQTQTPSKKCPLEHELVRKKPASYVFWTCNQCYKTRNSNKVKSQQQIFYCTQCLYCCCSQCAFCKNDLQYFEDKNGASYLSTSIVQQKNITCNQSHPMKMHHTNPTKSTSFNCSTCMKEFLFIGQVGMYSCDECEEFKCNFCTQSGFSNISNRKQYANHYVQSYVLDVPLCSGCDKPHKFSDHSNQGKQWLCRICKNPFIQSFHISCEKCQRHYCSHCKYKIKSKQQISVMVTECSCRQGTLKPKHLKLNSYETFMCMICYNRFYYNQPHHECDNCRFNFCNSCLETLKTKVKIHILSQDIQNRTIITEYVFQLPLTISLKILRESLKNNGIIPSQCAGKFKLPNRTQIQQQQQQKTLIANLAPSFQIFYLKTLSLSSQLINIFFWKMETNATNKSVSYTPRQIIKELEDEEQLPLIQFDDEDSD